MEARISRGGLEMWSSTGNFHGLSHVMFHQPARFSKQDARSQEGGQAWEWGSFYSRTAGRVARNTRQAGLLVLRPERSDTAGVLLLAARRCSGVRERMVRGCSSETGACRVWRLTKGFPMVPSTGPGPNRTTPRVDKALDAITTISCAGGPAEAIVHPAGTCHPLRLAIARSLLPPAPP